MVAPASPTALTAGFLSSPPEAAEQDRFTQRPSRLSQGPLATADTDTLRRRLEQVERRIARTSGKLERWRQHAERGPQRHLGLKPQLTTLAPAPWRAQAAAVPEAPSELATPTPRRPSLFDLPDAWTPSAPVRAPSPASPGIALDLVNEPLRESLLGAPALSEACRQLLQRLGTSQPQPSIESDLRLLDRLTDERKQVEQALLRVRAVQRGKLLARLPDVAPQTPRGSGAPTTSGFVRMPWRTAPASAAGYPPRLVRLVGGPQAMLALPVLDVAATLGPQGRLNQLEPRHLDAPLMRGAWPPHQLFLAFKLWQQPVAAESATAGLVLLVQDEVQPLSWHTLNPLRFRTEAHQLHETPTFMELRSERVIGNQEGERFLEGLERVACSAEGRLGIYSRERPPTLGAPRVSFQTYPNDPDEPPAYSPTSRQLPKKSALKLRTQPAPGPLEAAEPAASEVLAKAPLSLDPSQTQEAPSAAATASQQKPPARSAVAAAAAPAKLKAAARPVLATRRTVSATRVPSVARPTPAPTRGRPLERSDATQGRPPAWR